MTSRISFPRAWTAAVAFLLTISLAPAATAASPWVGTDTLLGDADHQGGGAVAAFDNAGIAYATWVGEGDDAQLHTYLSRRAPGDPAWSPRTEISDGGVPRSTPAISADNQGNMTVAWSRAENGVTKIETRTISATGALSAVDRLPDTVGASPDGESTNPVLLTGPSGTQTLIWREFGGYVVATKRTGDGDWPAAEIISDSYAVSNPAATLEANGDVTVVFSLDPGSGSGVGTTTYDASQADWSPVETFTTAGGASLLRLVSDGNGGQLATWFADPGVSSGGWIMRRRAGEAWIAPDKFADDGWFDVAPAVAPLGGGDLLTTWLSVDPNSLSGGFATIQAGLSSRIWSAASGTWDDRQEVTTLSESSWGIFDLVPLPSGEVVALVQDRAGGVQRLGMTTYARETATWSDRSMLPSSITLGSMPRSAVDADGNILVAWGSGDDAGPYAVHAAIADRSGPRLTDLAAPATATTDVALDFSVTASDAWSTVSDVRWEYGDGASATGSSATHAYAAAGTYTVTVSATDAAGNTTAQSDTVTVTDPPPPPVVKEKTKLPPVIPARLTGKKITITTTVPNCTSRFVATTKFGTTKYQTKLKLTKSGKVCTATGTITLKKAPSTRTKLRVAIGRVTKTGTKTITTLTTKRG